MLGSERGKLCLTTMGVYRRSAARTGVNEKRVEEMAQVLSRALLTTTSTASRMLAAPRSHLLPVAARGISEGYTGLSGPLYILLAMVGLILMIACGNVAMLLVSRKLGTSARIGIRLAVGEGMVFSNCWWKA